MSGDNYTISLMDAQRMGRILKPFADTDKPLEITISIHRRQRSLAQNAWMHGVCVPTVRGWLYDTQGEKYTHDEVYYYINTTAVRRKVIIKEIAGEEVPILEGKRFSVMDTKEFSEAVEDIVLYFAERGLEIHLPKPKTNNLLSNFLPDD